MRVYNRALSAAEITQLYLGSAPSNCDQTCVTYLKMDQNGGSFAPNALKSPATASGTLNNFTFDGTTNGWVAGKYGNGLLFNGSNNYVTFPDASAVSPGTGDMTMEAWVNPSVVNGSSMFIYSNYGSNTNNFTSLNLSSTNHFGCIYRSGGGPGVTLTGTMTPTAGTWYFVSCAKQGTTATLYVNGAVDATGSNAALAGTSIAVQDGYGPGVGCLENGSNPVQIFNGVIDDVRLYSVGLTASEVSTQYSAPDAATANAVEPNQLAAYFPLDESGTSATTAYATMANAGSGILNGTATWSTGNFGGGLALDGSTGYVSLSDLGLTSGTVDLWINVNTVSNDQRIFSQASGASTQAGDIALNQSSGESGSLWVWDGSAWQRLTPNGTIQVNAWNQIVVTFSGGTATAYVNGTQQLTAASAFAFSGVGASVGGRSWGTDGGTLHGAIDDVRVYSRVLQDYEIASQFRVGS